jgi:hypothetical protein
VGNVESKIAQKLHWKIGLKTCMYPFLGLLLTGLSAVLLSLSTVTVKWTKGVDPFTIAFFRFLTMFALSITSAAYSKVLKNVPLFPEGFLLFSLFQSNDCMIEHIKWKFYKIKLVVYKIVKAHS